MNRRTLLKGAFGILGAGALGTLIPTSSKPASAASEILAPPLVDGSVASSALPLGPGPWDNTTTNTAFDGGHYTGNNEISSMHITDTGVSIQVGGNTVWHVTIPPGHHFHMTGSHFVLTPEPHFVELHYAVVSDSGEVVIQQDYSV